MASFFVAAALQVLASITITFSFSEKEIEHKDYEDDKDQPPTEALERSRDGAHGVDEGSVGAEDNGRGVARQIVVMGSAECPEVHLCLRGAALLGHRQAHRRTRHGSNGSGGSFGSIEDLEVQLGKRAADKIVLGRATGDSEAHEHHHSKAETASRGDCGSPVAHILRKPQVEVNQNREQSGNHPLNQVPLSNSHPVITSGSIPGPTQGDAAIQMRSVLDGSNDSREERQRDLESAVEEEMKGALKFSYFSTGIAGAGIFGIFSGFISNQTGQAHSVHLNICTIFMLVTFVSGTSMILLAHLCPRTHVSIHIIRNLKYTTLAFLTLSTFDASFLFLKSYALVAFLPTVVIVMVAFIMALCHDGFSSSHQ